MVGCDIRRTQGSIQNVIENVYKEEVVVESSHISQCDNCLQIAYAGVIPTNTWTRRRLIVYYRSEWGYYEMRLGVMIDWAISQLDVWLLGLPLPLLTSTNANYRQAQERQVWQDNMICFLEALGLRLVIGDIGVKVEDTFCIHVAAL